MFILFVMLVFCELGNNDVSWTSAVNINCSPRWIVHPQSKGSGAVSNRATTLQQCLDACVANTNCLTAEWDYGDGYPRCWMYEYDLGVRRGHHPSFVHFDIVRQCNTMTGT